MRATRRLPGRTARLAGLSLAMALGIAVPLAGAAAATPSPLDTVKSFYATLLATMKQGSALGESGRYKALAPVVPQVFDVAFMTRLAVGPDWSGLTPGQQQEVTAAFGRYIAATYADRFDRYNGEVLRVDGEQPFAGGYIVQTKIGKPADDPTTVNYLMRDNGGTWQIADVYLDGTISQLATQHSEFHDILRRKGVDGLISALNHKVDLLNQP